MAIEPPFRPRVDALLKAIYSYDRRPTIRITDTEAVWNSGDAEMWSTSGEPSRLTQLVLNAHLQRLQVTFTALRNEAGFRIVVTSKGHAPNDSGSHHPGLSDLIAACYSLGGRPSDLDDLVDLLRRIAPFVRQQIDQVSHPHLLDRLDNTISRFSKKDHP